MALVSDPSDGETTGKAVTADANLTCTARMPCLYASHMPHSMMPYLLSMPHGRLIDASQTPHRCLIHVSSMSHPCLIDAFIDAWRRGESPRRQLPSITRCGS